MKVSPANMKIVDREYDEAYVTLSEDISAKRSRSIDRDKAYETYGEEELEQYSIKLTYPIISSILMGIRYNHQKKKNAIKSTGNKYKIEKYAYIFNEPELKDIIDYKKVMVLTKDGYAIEDTEVITTDTTCYNKYGDTEILIGAKALKYLIDNTNYKERERVLIEEILNIGKYAKNIELSNVPKPNYIRYTTNWYGPDFSTISEWGTIVDRFNLQELFMMYETNCNKNKELVLYKALFDKNYETTSNSHLKHRKEALRVLQNSTKETLSMLVIDTLITPVKNLYSTEKGSGPFSGLSLLKAVIRENDFQLLDKRMLEDPMKLKQFIDRIKHLQNQYDLLLYEEFENGSKYKGEGLIEYIMGKEGLIRNDILGKNIICSARAVIHPCPDIRIDQVKVPYEMLRDLFSYHIYTRYHMNVRTADPEKVREKVELLIQEIPIIVGRQPTLHILSKIAFYAVIDDENITSKSVGMSNWVTDGFNADFDGDQVVLTVPLLQETIYEVKNIAMSINMLLRPRDAKLFVMIKQEAIYGIYYLTKRDSNTNHKLIYSPEECKDSNNKLVDQLFKGIYAPYKDSTIGRYLVYNLFKEYIERIGINETQMQIYTIDADMEKILKEPSTNNSMTKLLTKIFAVANIDYDIKSINYSRFIKDIANIGLTVAKIFPPTTDIEYFNEVEQQKMELTRNIDLVNNGLITQDEFNLFSVESKEDTINKEIVNKMNNSEYEYGILDQVNSGARGKVNNINLLYGIKGSINIQQTNTTMYIGSNYLKGLNTIEHCMSSQGTTSQVMLKTLEPANTGYGMRKMVHIAAETYIREHDCGTTDYTEVNTLDLINILGVEIDELPDVIFNIIHKRYTNENIYLNYDLAKMQAMLMTEATRDLIETSVENTQFPHYVFIRTLSSCKSTCKMCYGRSMVNNELPKDGEAIGIIAATSLGEIGTQSTMKVFQTGGKSSNMSSQKAIEKTLSGKDIREKVDNFSTLSPETGTLSVGSNNHLIITDIKDAYGRDKPDMDLGINLNNMTERQIRETFAIGRHIKKYDVIGLKEEYEVFIGEIKTIKDINRAKWLMTLKLYAYYRTEDANIKHLESIVESILSYKIIASNNKRYSIGYYIDKGCKNQLDENEVKVVPEFVPYTDRETKDNSPLSGLAYQRIKDTIERFIETPYLDLYKHYDKRLFGKV